MIIYSYIYLYSPRHDITQLSSNLNISDSQADDLTDDVLYHEGTLNSPETVIIINSSDYF